jgi:hypothetical protein
LPVLMKLRLRCRCRVGVEMAWRFG